MIDEAGYRANVGIIISNDQKQVFWGHRPGYSQEEGWQFPQGGIKVGERPEQAMYRELYEEVGLLPQDVSILGQTAGWLSYDFGMTKLTAKGERYIGQKQIWFLLRLISSESQIKLTCGHKPEFDDWHWVDYDYPLAHVVIFKREVYKQALKALSDHLK